jgi:hypothetical protein
MKLRRLHVQMLIIEAIAELLQGWWAPSLGPSCVPILPIHSSFVGFLRTHIVDILSLGVDPCIDTYPRRLVEHHSPNSLYAPVKSWTPQQLEVFPTVCTNPLRAKSLFAAASPKGDLQVAHRISLRTSFIRLTSNALKSP